jgi:hypothetical protein
LKRIADQIDRSMLDPIGDEDDAVRIGAVGEDQEQVSVNDSLAAVGEKPSIADPQEARREPL